MWWWWQRYRQRNHMHNCRVKGINWAILDSPWEVVMTEEEESRGTHERSFSLHERPSQCHRQYLRREPTFAIRQRSTFSARLQRRRRSSMHVETTNRTLHSRKNYSETFKDFNQSTNASTHKQMHACTFHAWACNARKRVTTQSPHNAIVFCMQPSRGPHLQ